MKRGQYDGRVYVEWHVDPSLPYIKARVVADVDYRERCGREYCSYPEPVGIRNNLTGVVNSFRGKVILLSVTGDRLLVGLLVAEILGPVCELYVEVTEEGTIKDTWRSVKDGSRLELV